MFEWLEEEISAVKTHFGFHVVDGPDNAQLRTRYASRAADAAIVSGIRPQVRKCETVPKGQV